MRCGATYNAQAEPALNTSSPLTKHPNPLEPPYVPSRTRSFQVSGTPQPGPFCPLTRPSCFPAGPEKIQRPERGTRQWKLTATRVSSVAKERISFMQRLVPRDTVMGNQRQGCQI